MGKKNNVNPDHYKTEGRERPGQDIAHEVHKQKFTQAEKNNIGSKFIPSAEVFINELSYKDFENKTGQVAESADSSSSD